VVGQRQTGHPHLFRPGDQLGNTAHTIQQTVFGMNMQVIKHFG
jgi:hypothetical protein